MIWRALRSWRESRGDFRPCSTSWWEDELVGCAHDSVPVGPLNTYSSAAYGIAGAVLWIHVGGREGLVIFLALLLLTLGSMAYHAVPGRWTNGLDRAGMLAVFLTLAAFAIGAPWFLMLASALIGTAVFKAFIKVDGNTLMGIFLWVAALAVYAHGSHDLLMAALALYAVSMVFWQLGRRRIWRPGARYSHAIWHIGTALSTTLVFWGAS